MVREYPYLVAGLPALMLESDGKHFDLQRIKDELREGMKSSDYADMLWFVYPADNWNILSIHAEDKTVPSFGIMSGGEFTVEQLLNHDEYISLFPKYMSDYFNSLKPVSPDDNFKDPIIDLCGTNPQQQLLYRFYQQASMSSCKLVRDWYSFEHAFNNLKVAVVAKQSQLDIKANLLPGGLYDHNLTNNTSSDFGLRGIEPWIDDFFIAIDITNPMERERKMEMIRWQQMDKFVECHYIDAYLIFAFMMKALSVARWLKLDVSIGQELFSNLLQEVRGDYRLKDAIEE